MKFLRILSNDMQRVFSTIFLFSVAIMLFGMYLSCYTSYMFGGSLVSLFDIFFGGVVVSEFAEIYFIVSVLPSLKLYYQDLKSGNIRYTLVRANKTSYIISKVIANFTSAFLVIFVSNLIFIVTNFYIYSGEVGQEATEVLQQFGVETLFELMLLTVLSKCFAAAFFSIVCLVIANLVNNIFVITATPYIFASLLAGISARLAIPDHLSLPLLSAGLGVEGPYSFKLSYISIYFLVVSLIVAVIFYIQTDRKEV